MDRGERGKDPDLRTGESPRLETSEKSSRAPPFCGWWEYKLTRLTSELAVVSLWSLWTGRKLGPVAMWLSRWPSMRKNGPIRLLRLSAQCDTQPISYFISILLWVTLVTLDAHNSRELQVSLVSVSDYNHRSHFATPNSHPSSICVLPTHLHNSAQLRLRVPNKIPNLWLRRLTRASCRP